MLRKGPTGFRVGGVCEAPYGDKHYPGKSLQEPERVFLSMA